MIAGYPILGAPALLQSSIAPKAFNVLNHAPPRIGPGRDLKTGLKAGDDSATFIHPTIDPHHYGMYPLLPMDVRYMVEVPRLTKGQAPLKQPASESWKDRLMGPFKALSRWASTLFHKLVRKLSSPRATKIAFGMDVASLGLLLHAVHR
ncbi:hypothetical protein PGT21_021954 [Puccinia graminis f. sp. tritici]|uniref:Uncharacterized protein n=1 Tax=Puccinia graminis f. sp. tritici TaxID=56615 RepID=A0A5B0RIX3_PUCGR|nr:hypothetical protein PGT21_021954 [Puccinia graminis f. sp. tritici]KAA1125756.1 hypothetical protein PGTUg99_014856 [Puccinia graminis f. sp. tritici]